MRLRDLLSFNLFLQLTDGVISYQAFCAWGSRSQSCSSRCNLKLGNDLGTNLQQSLGVPAAAPDIFDQRQPARTGKAGIDGYGLAVRVRYWRLPLATHAITPRHPRFRHLRRTKYKFGSIPAAYRALPQLPKWASAALTKAMRSRRIRP